MPRHVFQARAPSRNRFDSLKLNKIYTDDLCVNLVCEYFCWMLGDTHSQITSFSDSSYYATEKKTKSVGGKF